MQLWTILDADGEVVQPCCATADADTHPSECGEPWEVGYQEIAIERSPDLHKEFWTGTEWKLDPLVIRNMRWEEVKAFAEERANGGFTIEGVGVIQTNGRSRESIRTLADEASDEIAAGNTSWSTEFKNEANVFVPVTALEVKAIYAAMRAFLGLIWRKQQDAEAALDQALAGGATGEELLAMDLTAEFP